jgi:hypothetical protein
MQLDRGVRDIGKYIPALRRPTLDLNHHQYQLEKVVDPSTDRKSGNQDIRMIEPK